jgi:hypothetical protein
MAGFFIRRVKISSFFPITGFHLALETLTPGQRRIPQPFFHSDPVPDNLMINRGHL